MFYSQLCLPDGSSVLLDGVVGGVTGISIPREKMTETQRSVSLLCVSAVHVLMLLCGRVEVVTGCKWAHLLKKHENVSLLEPET